MTEQEEIMDAGMPKVLNRETGEYEPLFKTAKEPEQKVTVIKEMVTVIMPEQVSAYLQFMGIKTLDLGNREHVETLKAFFLPGEEKQDEGLVEQPKDLATSEVVQPEESVLKAVHEEAEKESKKEVKKAPQKTDKKVGKKPTKKK